MLSRAGFRNKPGLSHLFCQQRLAQHVVDLMCAGMVQVFALQINLCAAQIPGHFVCVIQPGWPSGVLIK